MFVNRRKVWWGRFLALVVVFLALLGMLGTLLYRTVGQGSSLAPTPARTIPNTDVSPYGANFFLAREVEPWKLERTLQMAANAGIRWAKQQFSWEEIEPQRKGEYLDPITKADTWAKYDRIVEACERYGLEIVARLDRPPDWTRQDNTYKQRPPDNLEDYGDFVYAFVSRYQGRIHYIQIWNEPNIFPEWGNQPVNPEAYVELLKIAYRRAKEADPNVYVLSAPLAITLGQPHPEPGQWIAMSDLAFLERMYQAGAREYFDILSVNAFGMDRPPQDPPDPNVLNFQRVLLQRQIMERYGDANKAIWFNEYGWNAAPADMPADRLIWKRVTEKEQAEYTIQGIEYARREWPWAGVFMIWYFRQVGNISPDSAEYYFRMVDEDFTPRQLYFAVQDLATRLNVAGPGLYQETNPAVKTYGRWHPIRDGNALGGAYSLSETPGESLTFTFNGTSVDLISQYRPNGGRLLISLDGHSVPGLPTDDQGLSYIDLYRPIVEQRARIPLVRSASPGEHILRLTVANDHHNASTGTACSIDAFEVLLQKRVVWPIPVLIGNILGLAGIGWLAHRTWRRLQGPTR